MEINDIYTIVRDAEIEAFESCEKWENDMSFGRDSYQAAFLVLHFLSRSILKFMNKRI